MQALKAYLPVILWMAVIFTVSTDLGSTRRTSRLIGPVLRWFNPQITDEAIRQVQTVVRKAGHVVGYAVLAGLVWRARRLMLAGGGGKLDWDWRDLWFVLAVCALYAVTDEIHQSFVPSRQGSAVDVLIDTLGALCGLLAIWAAGRFWGAWKAAR